jgi:hypothetical protein
MSITSAPISITFPTSFFKNLITELRSLITPFSSQEHKDILGELVSYLESEISKIDEGKNYTFEADSTALEPFSDVFLSLLYKSEDGLALKGLYTLKAFFWECDKCLLADVKDQFITELGSKDEAVAKQAYQMLYVAPWERK